MTHSIFGIGRVERDTAPDREVVYLWHKRHPQLVEFVEEISALRVGEFVRLGIDDQRILLLEVIGPGLCAVREGRR